jgi:DNA (cytosine-5)-methyltransferase 1
MTRQPLTFGSLFAGCGGMDLGLERAGLVCKWQVEIDDYATRVLEKHWPDIPRWGDVRTFPPTGPEHWSVDCVVAGFPCQDVSYAGPGEGLDGKRSGLFYEAVRIIREVGPEFVVLENVAALLARGVDQVLGTLAAIGFDAEWHCIPAAHVGAPHIRDRVFVLAHSNRSRESQPEGCVEELRGRIVDGSEAVPNALCSRRQERCGQDTTRAGTVEWPQPIGSEWWVVEPNVGRVAHGIPARVDRIRCLGNAVVPQVAEWIGRRLMEVTAPACPLAT